MNDFLKILNELEALIKDSKRTMLGGNHYIDVGKCMDYILTLKSLLPQEIKEAQIILSEKENILKEANDTANAIVENAQRQADDLLDNSKIIAQAEYEANQIVNSANNEQNAIRYETMSSMLGLLSEAENKIIDILNCVRDSKNDLIDEYQTKYK